MKRDFDEYYNLLIELQSELMYLDYELDHPGEQLTYNLRTEAARKMIEMYRDTILKQVKLVNDLMHMAVRYDELPDYLKPFIEALEDYVI